VTNASADTIGASTLGYNAIVLAMPDIGPIQDYLNQPLTRPEMGDVLVKAPIPCFLTISFTLNMAPGTESSADAGAVQQQVATVIGNLGFTGQLAASLISQALHDFVGVNLESVTSIVMSGIISKPGGGSSTISSSSLLTIPTDYPNMTSGNTVAFLVTPAGISVTII
jgi:hypothetical protein